MLLFLSLISYKVFLNDPPVIFAYAKGNQIQGTLKENVDKYSTTYLLRPASSNISVRINNLPELYKTCGISVNGVYVYQNSTELQDICDANSSAHTIIPVEINSFQDACKHFKESEFIIATDHYPEFKKVGYSNPFTPGVWNCFFFIIFCLSFIIWSMIHYSNIDVQTRFAKKIN